MALPPMAQVCDTAIYTTSHIFNSILQRLRRAVKPSVRSKARMQVNTGMVCEAVVVGGCADGTLPSRASFSEEASWTA